MPGIRATMGEYGRGELRSGSKSGPVVTNPKQAIAIALNDKRKRRAKQSQTFSDIARHLESGE